MLQQALKFMIGLRSLRTGSYESFCFIRRLETGMIANRIIREAKKRKKDINVQSFVANKKKFNLIRALLNLKFAFHMWKE